MGEIYTIDFNNTYDDKKIDDYLNEMDLIFPSPLIKEEESWLEEMTMQYNGPLMVKKVEEE